MKKEDTKKILITFIAFFIIVAIFYYSGLFRKTCSTEDCFDEALKKCRPIDYIRNTNNNIYLYTIYRSSSDKCIFQVSLKSVAPGSDRDIKDLLEGKFMKCNVPKSILEDTKLDEINNLLSYCHGELKEGVYELIIKKIYGLVIGNINEVRRVVKGI